ncbi:unnamed protein product [Symbiodinium necroappetens]|uniref:Uncharacterized protein n=1 Tax=Symbiodinium necroappetens TaxID=1628268 RepID=A0A813A4V2_9DINO|nr:unnamed protein product [Symbiodinium necroappetens]
MVFQSVDFARLDFMTGVPLRSTSQKATPQSQLEQEIGEAAHSGQLENQDTLAAHSCTGVEDALRPGPLIVDNMMLDIRIKKGFKFSTPEVRQFLFGCGMVRCFFILLAMRMPPRMRFELLLNIMETVWAMGSDEPMKSIEGSEEWNFYQQYRPAGFQLASGPPSEVSTAATAEEREAKAAKLEKGGRGQSNKRQGQWGNGGGGRQNWAWPGNWKDSGSSGDGADLQEMQKLLTMMQKLALRHEDSINLLKLEYRFVAHMKLNVPASVVHMLYVAADGWRKVKAQEPQKLDRPMRTSLFVCLWAELKSRIQALDGTPGDVDKLAELGWLVKGPPLTWHFLKWDSAAQRSIIDTNKPPLTNAEVLEHIDTILANAVTTNSLARFHPTRPLGDTMQGESIVFLIQVGNFGDASLSIRTSLKALSYNAVLQLVATQLKEDRVSRSTLANNIAASIKG